jgi:hypothetical protein
LVAIAQGLCIKYDWLHPLKRPLDLGLCFRGKRIFGDHKTWRGLAINTFFCVLGTTLQARVQETGVFPAWLYLLDYTKESYVAGILLGLGMTVGELPNSFLKRQLDIAPGRGGQGPLGIAFFLYDQVDLAIGIWVFLFFLLKPSLKLILWSLVLTLFLHLAVSGVGYLLKMRKTVF